MSQQQDLFKKMNEDYESLARYIQPPLPNSQQANNSTSQSSAGFPQDLASQNYSNQYAQQNMYDPYAYGAGGYNFYAPDQQQFMGMQDVRGYDQYGGSNSYYHNRSGDYDRNGYQGRKPYQGYNNGKRYEDRERKPYNSFNRYNDQGGSSGSGGHGGFHIAGTKIFVNNIEAHITDVDITRLFGVYGKINDMKVFHRPDQNYAYIIYDRYEDAFNASNQPSPSPNWSISLAKSKNTVMQYQQSTMYSSIPGGAPPPPLPFKNSQKFYPGGGTVEQYKRQSYKYGTDSNSQKEQKSNEGESSSSSQPQSNQQSQLQDQAGKLPADSHLSNILNNCKDPAQLVDLMLLPPDHVESLATNKTQINQSILVREIWVSNIHANCQNTIRDIMEENFGPVEELEFFPRSDQSFAFIKFFMVQTAHSAFSNKEKIAELLEASQLKLTYSDPSRRKNIIGDHKDYMKDEALSPVLYVSFPYGFKISKHVILKIASDYGAVLNITVKRSEDPKQTSSVLIEFQDIQATKFAYSNLKDDHDRMNPRCEFAILLNSEKFIKENGLKLKDKIKEISTVTTTQRYQTKVPFNGGRSHYENGQSSNGNQDYSENYERENQQNDNDLEGGYVAEGSADIDENYNNEEDDEEYIWSGFISLKTKGRCGMDAKILSGPSVLDFENHNLIMNQNCPLDEPLKSTPYAVVLFKPSNQTQTKPFKEVKQYIDSTPNQAGVVVAKNFTIYLIPTGEEATLLYSELKPYNIVAICHTPESLRNQKSKKDQKIEEKYQARENATNQYPSSGQGHNYKGEEPEDEYDPTMRNDSKTHNETNLSDLIDNPNLVETMMKNVQ